MTCFDKKAFQLEAPKLARAVQSSIGLKNRVLLLLKGKKGKKCLCREGPKRKIKKRKRKKRRKKGGISVPEVHYAYIHS